MDDSFRLTQDGETIVGRFVDGDDVESATKMSKTKAGQLGGNATRDRYAQSDTSYYQQIGSKGGKARASKTLSNRRPRRNKRDGG